MCFPKDVLRAHVEIYKKQWAEHITVNITRGSSVSSFAQRPVLCVTSVHAFSFGEECRQGDRNLVFSEETP